MISDQVIKAAQQLADKQQQHYRWSRSTIVQFQQQRLTALLQFCQQYSPWYRKQLAGIDIATITPEQLSIIPPLTKTDLMNHWDEIVTDSSLCLQQALDCLALPDRPNRLSQHYFWATGGTSGRRAIASWSDSEFAHYIASVFRANIYHIQLQSPTHLRLASIVANKQLHMSYDLWSLPFLKHVDVKRLDIKDKISDLVMQLSDHGTTDIVAYPSVMTAIARYCLHHGLFLPLQRIVLTAEPVLEKDKRVIKQLWPQALISDFYGTTEVGPLAMECHLGQHKHLFEDANIIETVDNHDQPVALGQLSDKILVTNLLNKSLPLIRYEIDDQLSLAAPDCACGSHYRLLKKVEGRKLPIFYYGQLAVPTIQIDLLLDEQQGMLAYQVMQTEAGLTIHVQSEQSIDVAYLKQQLLGLLQSLGLSSPVIKVETCTQLQRHADSCKRQLFMPL